MSMKTKKVIAVSASVLASEHGCSVDLVEKLRKQGVLKKGKHWWVLNPTSARLTYRYRLQPCLQVLQSRAVGDDPDDS